VSVVNLPETIAAEDIVVPATLPLRPRMPRRDTVLSDHVVSRPGREVCALYYTWEYIENLDKT
jgi:hypothetical protein